MEKEKGKEKERAEESLLLALSFSGEYYYPRGRPF